MSLGWGPAKVEVEICPNHEKYTLIFIPVLYLSVVTLYILLKYYYISWLFVSCGIQNLSASRKMVISYIIISASLMTSIHPLIHPFIHMYLHTCIHPSTHPPIHPSIHPLCVAPYRKKVRLIVSSNFVFSKTLGLMNNFHQIMKGTLEEHFCPWRKVTTWRVRVK